MVVTGTDILGVMRHRFGLSYVLGAKGPGAYDCSGWIWQACRDNGLYCPHGTVNQYPWAIHVPLDVAINTPGALLIHYVGPNGGGGNGNHIAISDGSGDTSEAKGKKFGCGSWPVGNRFNAGALVPGVVYVNLLPPIVLPVVLAPAAPPPPSPSPSNEEVNDVFLVKCTDTGRFYAIKLTDDGVWRKSWIQSEWPALGQPGDLLRETTQAAVDSIPSFV